LTSLILRGLEMNTLH